MRDETEPRFLSRASVKNNTTTYRRNTMATVTIKSNEGELSSESAVLEVIAANPEYNRPALRIRHEGIHGGGASIRIDDPNPDIEFVETGLTGPDPGAGKFEIAVQADQLQINGRNPEVSPTKKGFDTIVVFERPAVSGNVGIGFKEAKCFKDFGGGKGVIAIANASVPPNESITGAGILYVEDGALMYRSPFGVVTMIARAKDE
jgi:hypothetical protein